MFDSFAEVLRFIGSIALFFLLQSFLLGHFFCVVVVIRDMLWEIMRIFAHDISLGRRRVKVLGCGDHATVLISDLLLNIYAVMN